MKQSLMPIHLCPQCGSRYRYMFLDEECPDCNYKFEKEESLNMIVHCPFCMGDVLAMRIRPYWGDFSGDPALEAFGDILREKSKNNYVEVVVRHIKFKSLGSQFETIGSKCLFELRCEQCEKELCVNGTNVILLMHANERSPYDEKKTELIIEDVERDSSPLQKRVALFDEKKTGTEIKEVERGPSPFQKRVALFDEKKTGTEIKEVERTSLLQRGVALFLLIMGIMILILSCYEIYIFFYK